jgi:hypothetical protein
VALNSSKLKSGTENLKFIVDLCNVVKLTEERRGE